MLLLYMASFGLIAQRRFVKSYEEKKKIAEDMKKLARSLGVKCRFCHSEADKGLRLGDFTVLTKKGEFAQQVMFPLAKKFFVNCGYCHAGKDKFTDMGKKAEEDLQFMRQYNRQGKKVLNCVSCHIPPQKQEEHPFRFLRQEAQSLRHLK